MLNRQKRFYRPPQYSASRAKVSTSTGGRTSFHDRRERACPSPQPLAVSTDRSRALLPCLVAVLVLVTVVQPFSGGSRSGHNRGRLEDVHHALIVQQTLAETRATRQPT